MEQEKQKSEKELRWEKTRTEAENITDALGKPIEENIKEVVTAFMANGFTTSASCEGHTMEEKHGGQFPWVEVYAPEPEEWKKSKEKQKEWLLENLKQRKKMMDLMEEFYKNRETNFDTRLVFSNIGIYGAFRIQSIGAELMPLFTLEEQKQKMETYRKEMNDFTGFLKNKFLVNF